MQLQGARSRRIIPEPEMFPHQKLVGRNEEQFREFSWEGRGGVNLHFESFLVSFDTESQVAQARQFC